MEIDFKKATFKDFENIPDKDINERSKIFSTYLSFVGYDDQQSYRVIAKSGCSPEMALDSMYGEKFVSYVSNDYLGFTQHPKVKEAAIAGIEKYGTGAGASPLIGGFFDYHRELEEQIAQFFGRGSDSSVIFTTGYTANSATLQSLLQKEDIAILDSGVHTSVHEGCLLTNKKTFVHNDLDSLQRILSITEKQYRTKLVIVDGVYSQDGDTAPLREILELCRRYSAYLMVDDAHGIGVIGKRGRGVLERDEILNEVDFITGTFSKTFGNIGGYVICSPENAKFLKFQSRQQIFSATAGASALGIVKAIQLIDEEPIWMDNLKFNINYFKKGFLNLGMDIGKTESAIFPVKVGDTNITIKFAQELMKKGIYTNPILYPAVAKNNSRIRISLSALHTQEQLNYTIKSFSEILEQECLEK